jgi:hypothetical protein
MLRGQESEKHHLKTGVPLFAMIYMTCLVNIRICNGLIHTYEDQIQAFELVRRTYMCFAYETI